MSVLISLLFGCVLVISTMAQEGAVKATAGGSSRTLQPWLLGLTAVVVFLFIVFVLLIVNRVWCTKQRHGYNEDILEHKSTEINAYENRSMELDEEDEKGKTKLTENKKAKWEESEEQTITAM
ncbi:hypothetical protein GDO86_000978 [Hymenochirus boettgeri]|uniref:Small integral membrane protein 24 n=1 Tax=Hymenochirus boettgeri TaxID=247094 RepID=A0A8T2KJ58_9PIPI|nr:hypothetical protein GDO86_000978 [Hymenochirus boettgeri]